MRRALLALALTACGQPATTPTTRIDEPRVLGVAVDPPVLDPGAIAMVRALVVDAAGVQVDVAPSVRACAPGRVVVDPDRDCGPDQSVALAPTGDGGAVLDVADVLARFPLPAGTPPASTDDPCPVAYGYVELAVIVEVDVDGVHRIARKQVRLAASPRALQNPVLGELRLDGAVTDVYPAGSQARLEVRPVRASLDWACTADTPPAVITEPLQIFLFSTGGDLLDTEVHVRFDTAGTESDGTTFFTGPPGAAVLWAVALDGDGGLGWAHYDLHAAP